MLGEVVAASSSTEDLASSDMWTNSLLSDNRRYGRSLWCPVVGFPCGWLVNQFYVTNE